MMSASFQERYSALQSQWHQATVQHKHHYLKYLAPRSPVDYVLVAKMTSIPQQDADTLPPGAYPAIPPPHYNLLLSLGDLSLNYGARRHLCRPGETYYVTDLGKCARPPKLAKGKTQEEEFTYWYPMLLKELELVAKPNAKVVPVGSATWEFLKRQLEFPWPLTHPVLHWSASAIVAAKMASSFFPQEWEDFRQTTSWDDLLASSAEILEEADLGRHVDSIDRRFKDKFGDTHRHYMFTYKMQMSLRR